MAISEVHYRLLEQLRDEGKLPQKCDLLEIGEANWYGDMAPEEMLHSFRPQNDFPNSRSVCVFSKFSLLELARLAYDVLITPTSITSIDPGGGANAIKHDLNYPIDLGKQFGLVMNHGTAEHVFNIANVYKVIHDHCEPNGVMIHESPWLGWTNHCFYKTDPTFFYDLATANNYRVEMLCGEDITGKKIYPFYSMMDTNRQEAAGTLPKNLTLFVVYRKLFDTPFRYAQQKIYSGHATAEEQQAWREMR